MNEKEILLKLQQEYSVVNALYPFPDPFLKKGDVKAVVLGADPTNIIEGEPKRLKKVFQLDNPKSPYWRSIQANLDKMEGVTLDNLYVQNLCRNYFNKETTQNPHWLKIARSYWAPFLKRELDNNYNKNVPVLMTTEFILHAVLIDPKRKLKAKDIYTNCITIAPEENILGRELIAFYRHFYYSLKKEQWQRYTAFLNSKFSPNE